MKKIYKFLSGFLATATVLNFSNSTTSFAEPPPPWFVPGDVVRYDSALETMDSTEYKYALEKGIVCPSYMDAVTTDEELENNKDLLATDNPIFKLPLKKLTGSVYTTLTFLYHASSPKYAGDTHYNNDYAVNTISCAIDDITKYDMRGEKSPVICWDAVLVENPTFIKIYGEPKKGDINIDGEITTDDALIVLNHVVGTERLPNYKIEQSDVDSDGEFTTNDALKILETVVGIK